MERLHVRRALTCLITAGLMLTAGVAPAAAAAPAGAPALTPGSRYLALGDSVTFGFQEAQVVPTPNYHRAANFLGYPEHLASLLRLRVTNASCPGETSASLIDAKAQSNGCENTLHGPGGYRTLYPLHVRYQGSQLAYAVKFLRSHGDVRLVSLMIGANDFFICEARTKDSCLSPSEQRAVFAQISRNVRTILSAIRNRAHYRGQIVIVNYYSLNYALAVANQVSKGLNAAQDSAARPFHVQIGDGYGEFAKQARTFGNNTCTAGLLTQWTRNNAVTCGVHPSYAGQALLAGAVLKAARIRSAASRPRPLPPPAVGLG